MHVSNMRPVKRLEDIIRAFALIQRALPARLRLSAMARIGLQPSVWPARWKSPIA